MLSDFPLLRFCVFWYLSVICPRRFPVGYVEALTDCGKNQPETPHSSPISFLSVQHISDCIFLFSSIAYIADFAPTAAALSNQVVTPTWPHHL